MFIQDHIYRSAKNKKTKKTQKKKNNANSKHRIYKIPSKLIMLAYTEKLCSYMSDSLF